MTIEGKLFAWAASRVRSSWHGKSPRPFSKIDIPSNPGLGFSTSAKASWSCFRVLEPYCLGSTVNSANRAGGKDEDLVQVLGYMNFSSGKPDGKTLGALNRLYGWAIAGNAIPGRPFAGMPAWLTIQQWLQDRLKNLSKEKNAFEENAQASQVLKLVWLHLLPDYLDFHNDLLFHHEPEGVFNGFFLGGPSRRCCNRDRLGRIPSGS